MIEGVFLERPDDPHVHLRNSLLIEQPTARPVELAIDRAECTWPIDRIVAAVRQPLSRQGYSLLQFDGELPDLELFRRIGDNLGRAMRETDPTVQPFVEDGVILHVVSEFGHIDKPELQPFSTDYLSLHSESSNRAIAEQPRYILLLCLDAGDPLSRAQTVLASMANVAARLSDDTLTLLTDTHYRRCAGEPTIARQTGDGYAFSFRDFRSSELEWTSKADSADVSDVDTALRSLLASMYDQDGAMLVAWQRGLMVTIDNWRFFHGRTRGESSARPASKRHLVRMRLC